MTTPGSPTRGSASPKLVHRKPVKARAKVVKPQLRKTMVQEREE
jgi:hypothetical protein